ncbi:efflux RND transporter periplasmic adaptor subunit [Gramella sp. GC03-9]|uniref:Efflux RND transporter periplasmic adaptor subunit n=1 Tax=Christiangramia oceanisediminis TaxID=2920386 RepID=A0A9X2IA85_9FLAO|nr:efflux RND transporter periplasmic adaptor subunit [Gramella oceanisediminis]MCP9199688.1 efflux RND transporter periplasmic adaptor subunit [Gramella oceanisediminis]
MQTNRKNIFLAIGILVAGIFLGWLFFGGNGAGQDEHEHAANTEAEVWTCSMHPQIRQPEPGQCPICGMDLIPLSEDEGGLDSDMFQMSEDAMKLANVRTMTVGGGESARELRLNGKVVVDERNDYTQTVHIPGRIEKLMVNFTGEKVERGQTLAMIYSPQLVTAQAELLQAQEIKESQPELFQAAKQKLRNWKISEAQIERMLAEGEPIERFPIRSDVSGVVTELMAEPGDHLEQGMPIYQIANLDKLWIQFDLYESDLNWVEEGSTVEYTVKSLPGKTFEGEISFVDPLLNDNTRVATARIEVPNKDRKLKPGMFVSGVVENQLDSSVEDRIVIPESAVLWTGERSVVYVKTDMDKGAGFEMREIILGPALADSHVVESGLKQGEQIVVNGTFTVDAAVQLAGKPSMMNPNIGEEKVDVSEEDRSALQPLFSDYFELKNALVNDDLETAKASARQFQQTIDQLQVSAMSDEVGSLLKIHFPKLQSVTDRLVNAANIDAVRNEFIGLSNTMINLAVSTRPMEGMYIQHCPMANSNQGADWLSMSSEIRNPYYGASMLGCGEVTDQL